MRKRTALLVAGLALVSCAAPRGTLRPERMARVGAVLDGLVKEGNIVGGVIAVAMDGRPAWIRTAGLMDREARKPMREDTLFRIYSMSKAIVTAGALTLVEEGRLGLDDPVGKHVPELKDLKVWTKEGVKAPTRQPTIRDLMRHTAGFTYGGGPPEVSKAYTEQQPLRAKNLDEMARRLAKIPLAYEPGTDWQYSVAVDVLGLVIQRVSGKRLDDFLEERLFRPLGMIDTGFHVPPGKVARFAALYRRKDGGLVLDDAPATSRYTKPPTFLSGGGGLVSTIGDYMRFLLAIEGGGGGILKPKTVELMTHDQLPRKAFPIHFGKQIRHGTGFGLGFSVSTADTEWDPQGHVGEYGWGGMASTHYWTSPRDRLTVVTMEQTVPYSFEMEFAVKGLIYAALERPSKRGK